MQPYEKDECIWWDLAVCVLKDLFNVQYICLLYTSILGIVSMSIPHILVAEALGILLILFMSMYPCRTFLQSCPARYQSITEQCMFSNKVK